MSTVTGVLSKLRGKIGEVVFQTNKNKTVAYQLPTYTDHRTKRSVTVRLRFGNIAHIFSMLCSALRDAFEDKATGISDYNMFTKENLMADNPVYLTKDAVDAGCAVVAPYCIGKGSRKPIKASYSNGYLKSNIALGDLQITAQTTVGAFATVVRQKNKGRIKEYDQITFIGLKQTVTDGYPYVSPRVSYVYLDEDSEDLLWATDYAQKAFQSKDGYLVAEMDYEGGGAWLLTHRNMDDTVLSANTYICCNNSILEQYTSERAFERAARSYGGYTDVLLNPGSDHELDNEDDEEEPTTTVTITAKVATGQDVMGTVQAGSSAAGATSSVTVAKNTSVQLKAVANAGYHFVQWNDGSTQATVSVVADATATYTATFAADTPTGNVTVTLTSENVSKGKVQINGGEQGATATATVTSGSSVTIKAISVAGYDFLKWSDNNQNYERTLTPTENVSLTAYFEEE